MRARPSLVSPRSLLAWAVAWTLGAGLAAADTTPAARRAPAQAPIPPHPDKLSFRPLRYDPPSAAAHRAVLKNGLVVFIAEDPALPLVNLHLLLRAGAYLEPEGQEGLADLTGEMLRRGGTARLAAEELDERLDFLATQLATSIGDTSGSATLNCLSDTLDESLGLLVDVLKTPRFQDDRLALLKEQQLQEMSKRNDDSADIEQREWNRLLNGERHFTSRLPTEASLRAITRDDLLAFQRRYVHPANMVAAVSGAFRRDEMLRKLEAAFADWPTPRPEVPRVPAELGATAAPGLYRVQKEVNQGRVSIGLVTTTRDSPDAYALEVMNEILGGGGFTSRITRTVRSNEGLAYSASSALGLGIYYPGRFRATFQSKSRSVAYAAELVLREIRRLRAEPPTAAELDTIKKNLVETFPGNFASAARSMQVFAADEYTGRDPSYWSTYRERIAAVTAADVQDVARRWLVPEKLIALVVGDQKEIALGDPAHPVKLEELFGGQATDLPLRDPMTLEAMK
jgi:predicted Zn-dependent peptidase